MVYWDLKGVSYGQSIAEGAFARSVRDCEHLLMSLLQGIDALLELDIVWRKLRLIMVSSRPLIDRLRYLYLLVRLTELFLYVLLGALGKGLEGRAAEVSASCAQACHFMFPDAIG